MSEQPPYGPPPGWTPPGPPSGPPPTGPPPMGPPTGWTGPMGPPPMGPPGSLAAPPRRSRIAVLVGVLLALVLVGGGIALAVATDSEDPAQQADEGGPLEATSPYDGPVDLSEVRRFDDLTTAHVEGEVDYEHRPPPGGEHFEVWLECGVYDTVLPDELVVHDLEHGTFWFAYDADALDAAAVAELAAQLPENGIMAPYDDLSAPVVVTVWGRQLALAGADDPRLQLFVDEYGAGTTAPEPNASCAGGVSPTEGEELLARVTGEPDAESA